MGKSRRSSDTMHNKFITSLFISDLLLTTSLYVTNCCSKVFRCNFTVH